MLDSGALDFYDFFAKSLSESGLQNTQFAKVGHCSKQTVSDLLAKRRRPPLNRIDDWADALGLKPDARREFKMLAGLAHVKDPQVRELIAGELTALRQDVADLRKTVLSFPQ